MSIQHKPNERVQLRASIHSGSVMAGIQVSQDIVFFGSNNSDILND